MQRRAGNTLRQSSAPPDLQVANNLPGRYPVERWLARYWAVSAAGNLVRHEVALELPLGWSAVCPPVSVGYPGCIQMVRRWGVALYPSILEDIGFDPAALLPDGTESDSGDLLQIILQITHFDLPGYFIIASTEHPFLLYDPDGVLKGGFTRWSTYLGALAYIVTGGDVKASFLQLADEAQATYQEAVGYLQEALHTTAGDAAM